MFQSKRLFSSSPKKKNYLIIETTKAIAVMVAGVSISAFAGIHLAGWIFSPK